MTEGYCTKCKARRAIVNVVEETRRDGRKIVLGECPRCGEELFKVKMDEFDRVGRHGAPAMAHRFVDLMRRTPSAQPGRCC
jgi:hypothetical protein